MKISMQVCNNNSMYGHQKYIDIKKYKLNLKFLREEKYFTCYKKWGESGLLYQGTTGEKCSKFIVYSLGSSKT